MYCFGHASEWTPELFNFFKLYTCSIELVHKDRIEKVFFELTDECRQRSCDAKWCERTKLALFEVPRGNPKEKVEGMIDKIVLQLFTMKHAKSLSHGGKSFVTGLLDDLVYQQILMVLSLIHI